jgi:hypothetical protein
MFVESISKFFFWMIAGAAAFGGWSATLEYRMQSMNSEQTEVRTDIKTIKETVIRIDERLRKDN